ncbi:hypothetical protein Pyn_14727 [Prunus yedoensis var. nudiflora]|uniref:Uncharacterized protein n=1 Tax=Prunus yedoensis var. nudiflora TaxID=2094558 RepID=A0A314UM74_PRUYE|nr:hypothetical protein Pyn_14727 [Prunus yedoensis var. nudiflora]
MKCRAQSRELVTQCGGNKDGLEGVEEPENNLRHVRAHEGAPVGPCRRANLVTKEVQLTARAWVFVKLSVKLAVGSPEQRGKLLLQYSSRVDPHSPAPL